MHEVAAVQGVVSTVLEIMRAAGASRVTRVELMLGATGHFTPEAARQHFDTLTAGTPVEGASLEILWRPATFQCFECLERFPSSEPRPLGRSGELGELPALVCPFCGGIALEVEHQDVCYARSIEVAFDDVNS